MEKMWKTDKLRKMGMIAIVCMGFAMSFNFCNVAASDPSPIQDFCIAVDNINSAVISNGMLCKDPKKVTVKDFMFKGVNTIGDTNNLLRSNATLLDVRKIPALNTQGVAVAHVDYGPFGLNTPHHHPRASEIFIVITGTIYAGFVTTDYRLFSAVLNAGDLFVFPQGLVHFQYNLKKTNARAMTAFGSQFPGRVDAPRALFGVMPDILDDVLTKAYQADVDVIEYLRQQFYRASNGDATDESTSENVA